MPNWVKDNLGTLLSIIIISVGGIVSFSTLQNNVSALESRVEKLETSNTDISTTLIRIDKKLALLLCRMDNTNCNLKE
jgi:hypothetical protein